MMIFLVMIVVMIAVVVVVVVFSVEDEASARIFGRRLDDVSDEAIEVVAVEMSVEGEAVVLGGVEQQFVVGQRVVAIRRQRRVRLMAIAVRLHLYVSVNLREALEESSSFDRFYLQFEVFWFPLSAMIVDNLSIEFIARLQRNLAMLLIVSIPTVRVSIAVEEVTDALMVIAPTIRLTPTALRFFELLDAVSQRSSPSNPVRIETGVQLRFERVDIMGDLPRSLHEI